MALGVLALIVGLLVGAEPLTRQQSFVVQSLMDGGKAGIGSGVAVGRDGDVLAIATAAHIVRTGGTLRIMDVTRRAYYDVIDTRVMPEYDLALVRVKAQKTLPIAAAPFTRAVAGERVWIWGNPAEAFLRLATGVVEKVNAELPGEHGVARVTIACALCNEGDSGSGVFDEQGRLIGILTTRWETVDGANRFFEVQPVAIIERELALLQPLTTATLP